MKGVCRMSAKKLRTITSVICFLMIFAYVIYLQAVWSSLPERVPIHFDLHGVPNRYGKRGFLFFEPILALLILGLMMFCENIPQDWCNFPVEVTEENKEQLYEIGIKMMSMLKLTGVAVCLYAGISGNLSLAPMWPVWILIGGCFGIVIWGIRAMKKAGKDQ